MKEYTLELSEESLKSFAQKLSNMPIKLEKIKNKILKKLAQYTKERIQYYISESTGNTGYNPTEELLNSIEISDIFNNTIEVYTESALAMYVEYGTGIVGSENPHTEVEGWKYDVNEHGEKGWFYQDTGGNWHWTKGQKAHEFMYKAFQDLEANYMSIAEQIFNEEDLL